MDLHAKRAQLDALVARTLSNDSTDKNNPAHAQITTMSLWASEGDTGRVMCVDCIIPLRDDFCPELHCYGCPKAWRSVDGKVEYWKKPEHEYVGA